MLKLHQTHWKDAFKIEACQQPNKMKTNESQGEAQTDAEVWQMRYAGALCWLVRCKQQKSK